MGGVLAWPNPRQSSRHRRRRPEHRLDGALLVPKTGGWQESNVNVLTKNDAPFNDMVGTYTLRGFQVQISKADGAPEGIWQKPQDFKPWMPEPSDTTPNVKF